MLRREALSLFSVLAAAGVMPQAVLAELTAAAEAAPEAKSFGMSFGPSEAFTPETVVERARALAATPYEAPPAVADDWMALDYDHYRKVWFDTRNSLYRDSDSPVRAEFFPAGMFFAHKIRINAVEGAEAREVLFEARVFDSTDRFPDLDFAGSGYSGVRLVGELEVPGRFQEYAVFQGASYFRAIAQNQIYGISARGLALNTAEGGPEEFPTFREFWVEKAEPGSPIAVVYALLDSPSVTGAYRFAITKGAVTTMEVTSQLFPRVEISRIGIAPGTSMMLFNGLNRSAFDDFRGAVHDSDGLLMMNANGEVLWRPLTNPKHLQISSFSDQNPRGFGLMQRLRDPNDFNDLSAIYERRPSLWVEPIGDWGPGQVMLVEIPTDMETNDNIVAFWRPATPLAAGSEHRYDYKLFWCNDAPSEGAVARVLASRTGARVFETGRIFAIDFEAHPALGEDPSRVEVRVSASSGEVPQAILQRNDATGGMRLDITLREPSERGVELRAELWREGRRASEVWLYRWIENT